ncbi:MAG: Asp-tRNA(Asn)/Glu-tRNA(Gln) amidotransferase subunit GatA [Planctomycetota bacterium]
MKPYADLDATALAAAHRARERTVRSSVDAALAGVDALDRRLGILLDVQRDAARARADELDHALLRGEPAGPLFGVPVVLKANMCLAGVETNCASRMLAGWKPPYTATFVQRLLDAGAVVIGMANMDEFAMGSSSENSAFFPSKNPWDETRTPGGSSSGSAVAVASGLVPISLGSDTGGSVRQPAALCNVLGYKPTYGTISRYGLVAFGSSLDQVSPFARSVRDLELVTSVISGADPMDSTCFDAPPFERAADGSGRLDGLRVGVPREHFAGGLDAAVRTACERALETLRGLGAELVPVSLPHTELAIPTYYVVATAEASSNLARFDGVRYGLRKEGTGSLQSMFGATRAAGFGPEVKRRILLGTYVLSAGYYDAWYGRALKVRSLLRRDFEQAFEHVDVLAGPTSPTAAFRLGEKKDDPVAMYLADVLTVPVSLAGLPAISVPCGFVEESGTRLPVGLQFVGRARGDARLLAVARAYESATGFARERAPLHVANVKGGAA